MLMPKRKRGDTLISKVKHNKILDITQNAYILGLAGGVITLAVSLYLLWQYVVSGLLVEEGLTSVLGIAMFVHIFVGVLMILAVFLLRREHHSFSGSVMLLCASIIGLNFASGLLIGPVLGIIGGILGLSEHEKMIRQHLE